MPLIKYAAYIYLPGGNPAANMLFPIRITGGNVLVPLRADKAGVSPLSNPLSTDEEGLLEFYAAPGTFCVELAGEMTHIMPAEDETDAAWPGTFIHDQSTPQATWTVNHYFGVEPSVSCLVAGQHTEVDVMHPDAETTVITFAAPTVGVAYLRR